MTATSPVQKRDRLPNIVATVLTTGLIEARIAGTNNVLVTAIDLSSLYEYLQEAYGNDYTLRLQYDRPQ